MRITYLLFIFLCISCQLFSKKDKTEYRKIAGIFEPTTKKVSYETVESLNSKYKWLILPNNLGISSIKIDSKDIDCKGKNFIKVNLQESVVFYTQENSLLKCMSLIDEDVSVTYHFYDLDLSNINQDQINSLNNILNKKLSSLELKKELINLDLYHLFHSKISIEELNEKVFLAGDIVELNIVPKVYTESCPDGECNIEFNPVISKVFYKNKFDGQNQLRYPNLKPFLFFCGTRYAAGNIVFRADRNLSLQYAITENGFSCDINSFLLSNDKPKIELDFAHYSQQRVEQLLLSKKETLLEENRKLKKEKIKNFSETLKRFNEFQENYLSYDKGAEIEKGYLEIWWEPYYECLNKSECIANEFGVTKIRFIYQDRSFIELQHNLNFLHFKLNKEDQQNAIVQKLCPSEKDQFVEKFLIGSEEEKYNLLKEDVSDCRVKSIKEKRVRFGKRTILHNYPETIEENEVDIKVERFKPFGVEQVDSDFLELLNQRKSIYLKPRLIEILNN